MAKISIIVPVYNAQNWIHTCIESLLAQTEREIEILLVDDKSTDNSLQICEDYAARDNRVRIIKKENGGPHSARKAGTDVATAEYVMYVDSDDWIEADMAERMFCKIKESNSQCLICGYTEHVGNCEKVVHNKIESGIYSGMSLENKVFNQMLCPNVSFEQGLTPALWGKLFIKEIMQRVMKEVDEDIWIGEDLACTIKYLFECKQVQIDNSEQGYHYITRSNTITTKYDPYYFDKTKRLGEVLEKALVEKKKGFLKDNINNYKLYLLYREIGVALDAGNKYILKSYYSDIRRAAASSIYQQIKEVICWEDLKVTPIEKRMLQDLLYGRYVRFKIIFLLMYWNRKRQK